MSKVERREVSFLTEEQLRVAIEAAVAYTTDYCVRMRDDMSKNRLPAHFSLGVCRLKMFDAVSKVGKKMTDFELLDLSYDPRLYRAMMKELKYQGHKMDKGSNYAWPIEAKCGDGRRIRKGVES